MIQNASNGMELILIQDIQTHIWDDNTIDDEYLNDLLTDIAYRLDFYEPNAEWRKESPNYYGREKLNHEINWAIDEINKYENKI